MRAEPCKRGLGLPADQRDAESTQTIFRRAELCSGQIIKHVEGCQICALNLEAGRLRLSTDRGR